MEEVYRKFKYVEVTDFNNLTSQWTEALGVTLHEFEKKDGFYVEVPPLKIVLENIRKYKQPILTDCRFFTMLMGCLKNNPDKKNLFSMWRTTKAFEIMVPKGCLYLTLNRDYFVLPPDDDNDYIYLSKALKTDQGQWIVEWDNLQNKSEKVYLGIVDEGPIIQSITKWVERYQKCVQTHINKKSLPPYTYSSYSIYMNLLSFYVEKHGINVGCYEFNNRGDSYNVYKNSQIISGISTQYILNIEQI